MLMPMSMSLLDLLCGMRISKDFQTISEHCMPTMSSLNISRNGLMLLSQPSLLAHGFLMLMFMTVVLAWQVRIELYVLRFDELITPKVTEKCQKQLLQLTNSWKFNWQLTFLVRFIDNRQKAITVLFQKRVRGFHQVSKQARRKHLKPRGHRPSGFIVFECLETWWNPKQEFLKIFEITSPTKELEAVIILTSFLYSNILFVDRNQRFEALIEIPSPTW